MQARQPPSSSSVERLPMHERNRDLLSALAAGPPSALPSSSSTAATKHLHHRTTAAPEAVDDEDLHAADGLEDFQPDDSDGAVDWQRDVGGGFDSRQPVVDAPKGPVSSYALSGTPALGQFGTPQLNTIGRDLPREIVRVERDWVAGDVAQFHTSFPLELEGRISATKFQDLINDVNTLLLSANSSRHAVLDNLLMVATMHLSLLWASSHFQKELHKLERLIEHKNAEVWHPAGLSIRSPRAVAFQFLEIEYY